MPTLFVTGGCGFIGSNFIRHLLRTDPDVRVFNFDALTYAGNLDNVRGVDAARHRFIRGDIADNEAVHTALEEGVEYRLSASVRGTGEFRFTYPVHTSVKIRSSAEASEGWREVSGSFTGRVSFCRDAVLSL